MYDIFRSKFHVKYKDIEWIWGWYILTTNQTEFKNKQIYFELLYRASENGFGAKEFHSKCDNHPDIISIIHSGCNYIFGSYLHEQLQSPDPWENKCDNKAFMYRLRADNDNSNLWVLMINEYFIEGS